MEASTNRLSEETIQVFLRCHSGGERILLAATIPTVISGIVYVLLEKRLLGNSGDLAFVILLALATIFLALGVAFLRRTVCRSAAILFGELTAYKGPHFPKRALLGRWKYYVLTWKNGVQDPGELLELLLDRRVMVAAGIIYGLHLGLSPIIVGVHATNETLQVALITFMFCANTLAGAALYSAITLLRQTWHLGKRLDVTFFSRRNEASRVYAHCLASLSIIGAIYLGICQASVVFSRFSGVWVYGYAVFAMLILIAVYYVPQMPIRARLAQERQAVLINIDLVRSRLLFGELNSNSLDQLCKLHETETQILEMGLGLSRRNSLLVLLTAVSAASLPFVSTFLDALLKVYLKP